MFIVVYNNVIGRVIVDTNKNFKFLPYNYGEDYCYDDLETITKNMVRIATHEEKIQLIKEELKTFGKIMNVHCIEEYQIIEVMKCSLFKETIYCSYVNYNSINEHYKSLDAALIGCIGYKYEQNNIFHSSVRQATTYFMDMLKLE